MRLVWNEPFEVNFPWYDYSRLHWKEPLIGWLNYMGVFPKKDSDHFDCSYNYVHHFFDIYIYECWLPGHGEPDAVIKAMRKYLQSTTLDWQEHSTYRWDNGKQRPGVRFWIQAENYPRKRLTN